MYWTPIVGYLAVGLGKLGVGLFVAFMIWSVASGPTPAPPQGSTAAREFQETRDMAHRIAMQAAAYAILAALLWWTLSGYLWLMYSRWGRVPRVLTATDGGLAVSSLGWWRMRERNWPKHEIESVQFRVVKGNLIPKRTVGDLYIKRRNGRRLHFRLGSSDPNLPEQIARQMAQRLNCPCKT